MFVFRVALIELSPPNWLCMSATYWFHVTSYSQRWRLLKKSRDQRINCMAQATTKTGTPQHLSELKHFFFHVRRMMLPGKWYLTGDKRERKTLYSIVFRTTHVSSTRGSAKMALIQVGHSFAIFDALKSVQKQKVSFFFTKLEQKSSSPT